MDVDIIPELEMGDNYVVGPQKALISVSFTPEDFSDIGKSSSINFEEKDQDFVVGSKIHYRLSTNETFQDPESGEFTFAVWATECKRHLDKTMYREQVGTAAQLKGYVPFSKYFVVTDYLDMKPANPKLTKLDNVFVLRKSKRLSRGKRKDPDVVREHLDQNPLDKDVVGRYVEELREFLDVQWFEPSEALDRGSFV